MINSIVKTAIFPSCFLFFYNYPQSANAISITANPFQPSSKSSFGISDEIITSLKFEKILGQGAFKTVYLVSSSLPSSTNSSSSFYALAVQRLKGKSDTRDGLRGIYIPKMIQETLVENNSRDKELFETTIAWWIQSKSVVGEGPENLFEKGKPVFPFSSTKELSSLKRTQKEPSDNFLGFRWLVSFKPVYEIDLKRFIQKTPLLYYPTEEEEVTTINSNGGVVVVDRNSATHTVASSDAIKVAGLSLTDEPALMKFILEILRAGKIIHSLNLVHRDIKPKNIMISKNQRPVIIDYGFAGKGKPSISSDNNDENNGNGNPLICINTPGQIKGESTYVLGEDVAKYRGCQRGDTFAMGKTLYEFIFGEQFKDDGEDKASRQQKKGIFAQDTLLQNEEFRTILMNDDTTERRRKSRFRLSRNATECLLGIMRGLCQKENNISFEQAERMMLTFLNDR